MLRSIARDKTLINAN